MDNNTRRAIGYVRVSTEGQAEDGVSLAMQSGRIRAWAAAHGYELAAVYEDAGRSGSRADNRPGLAAAIDRAVAERAPLVVFSLSRLARSVRDTLAIAERLGHAGADLVSLSERIDTTTAAGKMVFRMLAVLAEFERDVTAERTAAALAHLRCAGRVYGQVPYGFRREGERLVEIAEQQEAIRLIRQRRGCGASWRAIAAELGARGYVAASGGAWNPATVMRIHRRVTEREVA